MEDQHVAAIEPPALVVVGADAGQAIEAALDRQQHRRQQSAPAGHDRIEIAADRPRQQQDDDAEQRDLHPAIEGHQNFSGRANAITR
jgi:hypothetical protein